MIIPATDSIDNVDSLSKSVLLRVEVVTPSPQNAERGREVKQEIESASANRNNSDAAVFFEVKTSLVALSVLVEERDENGDIIRIWLKFPKSCGRKQATKLRNLSARLNLDDDAVPITSQTSSVALNNNKTIIAKRKHFPLVSALAMTIHKSQGGTYDAIVYEYDRKHPRELVYVALSRVTKIEGLFMVTKENTEDSWKFWIGRSGIPLNASESDKHLKRSTSHREDLTLELKKIEKQYTTNSHPNFS
ncbi:uvrD_C_2 domain-containing protein [Trichonephila clavipes]|nr:uvrD_C_2 domain-containing protein [Trichonephila clavipes]